MSGTTWSRQCAGWAYAHAIKAHTALARMDGTTQGAASQEIHLVEFGSAEKLVPAAGSASARHANLSRQPHLHHVAHVARSINRSAPFSDSRDCPHLGLSGDRCVRRSTLSEKGALRWIERSNMGHWWRLRLPGEVRVPGGAEPAAGTSFSAEPTSTRWISCEAAPCVVPSMREGGVCFYCMRHTPSRAHCLDHVVPLMEGGSNSYATWFPVAWMQFGEKGPSGRGFFATALPRGALVERGSQRTPARRAGTRRRQISSTGFQRKERRSEGGTKHKGARGGATPRGAEVQGLNRSSFRSAAILAAV